MPHSTHSSSASATSRPPIEAPGGGRFEWRPSRWLVAAQALLGVLGGVSVLISGMPGPWAWVMASAALGWGLVSARRCSRRRPRLLAWSADATQPALDGQLLADARLHWRGPLAFLCWREGGRRHHLSWWPDTLPPAQRRELRLAAGGPPAAAQARSMAG